MSKHSRPALDYLWRKSKKLNQAKKRATIPQL